MHGSSETEQRNPFDLELLRAQRVIFRGREWHTHSLASFSGFHSAASSVLATPGEHNTHCNTYCISVKELLLFLLMVIVSWDYVIGSEVSQKREGFRFGSEAF